MELKSEVQKANRARLFRKSRPKIRQALLFTDHGYGEDMGVLWAAYKAGSFALVENQTMTPDEFGKFMTELCVGMIEAVIVEDDNKEYASGRGPVAFIGVYSDGWKFEPHVDYFSWATRRNILRTSVAFMQFMRYHKEVGVCVIRVLEPHVMLFKRVARYATLNYIGRIFKGTPRGDEHIFSVAGKKRSM